MTSKSRMGFCAAGLLGLASLLGVSAFAQSPGGGSPLLSAPANDAFARSSAGNPILIDLQSPASQRAGAAGVLRQKAGLHGGVRVIIGLRLNWRSPDELSTAEAAAQSGRLRAAQNAIVNRVVGSAARAAAVRTFDYVPYVALNVNRQQLDQLVADPNVATILEDVPAPPSLQESVPFINADEVVADGFPGRRITVAILDTGVDKGHRMFRRKVVSEACYSTTVEGTSTSVCPGGVSWSTDEGSGVNCPASISSCDHGTHVAGIAAGHMKSPLLRGVAPSTKIIAIQVNSSFAGGCAFRPSPCAKAYVSDQVKGLERVYALRKDFKIAAVNISLGGGTYQQPCDAGDPLTAIIKLLRRAWIATVISSGNNGYNGAMSSPACISHAIAVGSTLDTENTLSDFSNNVEMVRLLAPGSDIVSSVPDSTRPKDATAAKYGTSMAAPHVTGAFALLRDVKRARVEEISAALECTGVDVTRAGITERRIDVAAAKDYLLNPPDPTAFFNFNSASQADAWTPLLGTWEVSGGRYYLTDITPGWKLSSTYNCHNSVTIDAVFRRGSGQTSAAGMFFKSQISDVSASSKRLSGYLALIGGNLSPTLKLWRYDQANLSNNTGFAKQLCTTPIASSVIYSVKVTTIGGRHQVSVNNVPYCDVVDNTYGTGRAGVLTMIENPTAGNTFYAESFLIQPAQASSATSAAGAGLEGGQ